MHEARPLISEVEILNNFWPFRFLKGVLIFIFIKNANLAVQIFGKVFTFSISSNHKSGRPDFWKGVHICVFDENRNVNTFSVQIWTGKVFTFWFSSKTKMWTPFQKSGRPDLRFEKKWKCEHVFLYDLFRFAIWNKMKIRTPFRNLNGQKLLGVSISGHLSEIWMARNCWGFPPQDKRV